MGISCRSINGTSACIEPEKESVRTSKRLIVILPVPAIISTPDPTGHGNHSSCCRLAHMRTAFHFLSFAALMMAASHADAQQPQAGFSHALLLCPDSTVHAWGRGTSGEMGNGNVVAQNIAVQTQLNEAVVQIAAGSHHGVALDALGDVWTWGHNAYGQLGIGSQTDALLPTQVPSFQNAIVVRARHRNTYAVRSDGSAWGCGYNFFFQLGIGTQEDSDVPVQVSGITGVTDIEPGRSHVFAKKNDGTVWAWGSNMDGMLGTGSPALYAAVPELVPGLSASMTLSGGHTHSLARKPDGTVIAWGWNGKGQLGTGNTSTSVVPVPVGTLSGITNVSAGEDHSLALAADGTVWAWGWNNHGQLGIGTTTDSHVPVPIAGLTNVVTISAGARFSIAVKDDGSVWTWGSNSSGQLGNGTSVDSSVPVQVISPCGISTSLMHTPRMGHDLRIWPNPAVRTVDFELHGTVPLPAELHIRDLTGRTIGIQRLNSTVGAMDLGGVAPGIYLLSVAGRDERTSTRLVLQ